MALEATHIRFALDLKDEIGVGELDKYLSGTIYPDSRYLTKIHRKLTHSDSYTKKEFYDDDDFKKGWAVHLICDALQRDIIKELFPDLLKGAGEEIIYGKENWITRTAIKIIQDILDAELIGVRNYVKYLGYCNNPNGEKLDLIKKYNQIFIDTYNKDLITYEDEFKMWQMLGLDQDVLEKIMKKTAELKQNQSVVDRVKKIYDITKSSYKNANRSDYF